MIKRVIFLVCLSTAFISIADARVVSFRNGTWENTLVEEVQPSSIQRRTFEDICLSPPYCQGRREKLMRKLERENQGLPNFSKQPDDFSLEKGDIFVEKEIPLDDMYVDPKVHVYKSAMQKQCDFFSKIDLFEMEKELSENQITVYYRYRAINGFEYPVGCGNGTSLINVYTIDEEDLERATDNGFRDCAWLNTQNGGCYNVIENSMRIR